jgi:hypothetical protein
MSGLAISPPDFFLRARIFRREKIGENSWAGPPIYENKRVKECLPERMVIFLSAFFEGILLIPT